MSEIKINYPISFDLSVIETDDRIPSFKIELINDLSELTGEFKFIHRYWVSNESWDKFIENPFNGLEDLDGVKRFLLMQKNIDIYIFEINMSFKATSKEVSNVIRYTLNTEEKIILVNKFEDFLRWW